MEQLPTTFVTVTEGVRGYFPVVITWDVECDEFVPEVSFDLDYSTRAEAEVHGAQWAKDLELEFVSERS